MQAIQKLGRTGRRSFSEQLEKYLIDDQIPLPKLLLTNEMDISGKSEKDIWEFLDQVSEVMVRGVDTGLSVDSVLPGPIKLRPSSQARKAVARRKLGLVPPWARP
jgi:L-serine deaminase